VLAQNGIGQVHRLEHAIVGDWRQATGEITKSLGILTLPRSLCQESYS
jgi:hypothetical protein